MSAMDKYIIDQASPVKKQSQVRSDIKNNTGVTKR